MAVSVTKSAKFYDGKTSTVHVVSVDLSGSILRISSQNGEGLASWSLNTLTIIELPSSPAPGVISSDKFPDARLKIDDGKGWKYLTSRIPKANKTSSRLLPTHWSSFFGYGAVSVLSITLLFMMFPRILSNLAYFIPASWETELGQNVITQLVDGHRICAGPKGQAALDKLTKTIKSQFKRDIEYSVQIIDNRNVLNAFAAPGGHIVFYRKVIEDAGSPEELAGVLAHEMAHIELYHTTKGLVRDMGLTAALSFMIGHLGSLDTAIKFLNQMQYSREDERAADNHAKITLNALNINPEGLGDFLERVSKMEQALEELDFKGKEYLDYLSSHPNTIERIKALKGDKGREYAPPMSAPEWQDILEMCKHTKPLHFKKSRK